MSIGVAMPRSGKRDVSAVLARADRALYAAKTGGRNRVAMESETESESEGESESAAPVHDGG